MDGPRMTDRQTSNGMHGKSTALAPSKPCRYGVVRSRQERVAQKGSFILAVCRIHVQLSTRWTTQKPQGKGLRVQSTVRSTHEASVAMGNEAYERVETRPARVWFCSAGVCCRIHPSRAHLHDGMRMRGLTLLAVLQRWGSSSAITSTSSILMIH
ncbi:hypothetical protein J3F84DRAFT_370995 [Trichoderma pleuroticola]